ncbi:hypothetical protein [Trebonia sp.]|uniref:hypothetical protein n=1 Tax=Trebonia sp. TaxID=2767075 RepID=UPI0026157C17|nr:hypothetical protein [Trebonia sp.]
MTVNTITPQALSTARSRACPLCQTPAGEPCQPKPAGDHLARYLDAYTAGQLTRAYMATVLGELVVMDACVIITEPAGLPAAVASLLADGHTLTYAPDTAWDGWWWADLRDGNGRLRETGSGATHADAAADLARRLGRAR